MKIISKITNLLFKGVLSWFLAAACALIISLPLIYLANKFHL